MSVPRHHAPLPGAAIGRPSAASSQDQCVALLERFRALNAQSEAANRQHEAVREVMVTRHGELARDRPEIWEAWNADADYDQLVKFDAEATHAIAQSLNVVDQVLTAVPTSLAGIRAKLELIVELWPPGADPVSPRYGESELHEDVALAVVREAVRLLEGGL